MKTALTAEDILETVMEIKKTESELRLSERLYHFIEFDCWGKRENVTLRNLFDDDKAASNKKAQAYKVDLASGESTLSILLNREHIKNSGASSRV